jgi:hypothetical protein
MILQTDDEAKETANKKVSISFKSSICTATTQTAFLLD